MRKKRNKGISKVIVLMTISLSMLMLVNNTFEIISSTFNGLENTVLSRRLEVQMDWEEYYEIGEEVFNKLSSFENDHILGVYLGGYTEGIIDGNNECGVTYISEKVLEEYMNKKNFKLKDNEVILPKYENVAGEYIERKEEEYIGKNIEYTVYKKQYTYESEIQQSPTEEILDEKVYTLKVVGLYDNAKSALGGIIVSEKNLMEMKDFSKPGQSDNTKVYMVSDLTAVHVYITIDEYKNAEEVKESVDTILKEYGLDASTHEFGATDEFHSLRAIKLLANIAASFLLVCATLSLFSYIKDMMNRRKQEFGIMKAIGYKTSGICKTLIKELVLEIVIPLGTAFILGIAAVVAADIFLKNNFDIYEYAMFDIKLYGNIAALVFGIAAGLPILGYTLTIIKINRLEPMEALK